MSLNQERNGKQIGDLLYTQMKKFAAFEPYLERLESILHEIESSLQLYPRFLQVWRSFESRKLCYLPISTFLIKPLCRLFQYYSAIGRMERLEGSKALNELAGPVNRLRPVLRRCLQYQIMSQARINDSCTKIPPEAFSSPVESFYLTFTMK